MKRSARAVALSVLLAGCAISTQQEVELGTQYSQQINAQLPIVSDPEVNRYINLLGSSLARVADNRSLQWRFYVVDSREVNAFAVPGGFVYVNRGLIERATRMNHLAGVLGHEIGHVTRRHSVKQMQSAQRANAGLTLACILTRVCENQAAGAAIQIGGSALFAKFSRDDEAQADQEGVKNLVLLGRAIGMLPRFEIEVETSIDLDFRGLSPGVSVPLRGAAKEYQRIETALMGFARAASTVAGTVRLDIRFAKPAALGGEEIRQLRKVLTDFDPGPIRLTGVLA